MNATQRVPGIFKKQFPRRAFLRGVGVTMALPWLESISSFANTTADSTGDRRVRRVSEAIRRNVHGQWH